MNKQGLRIWDKKGRPPVHLSDILELISQGDSLHWAIVFVDGTTTPENGAYLTSLQQQITLSPTRAVPISWEKLKLLSPRFRQLYEIILIGSTDASVLKHYPTEDDMYQRCEWVIEMIDCVFWEIHAKDTTFLEKCRNAFEARQPVEWL